MKFIVTLGLIIYSLPALCTDEIIEPYFDFSRPINARDCNLPGYDFRYKDLTKSDFSEARLRRADFRHARLDSVIFYSADLTHADFRYADLTGADFTQANINGARFKGAQLSHILSRHVRSAKGTLFEDDANIHVNCDDSLASLRQNQHKGFIISINNEQSLQSIGTHIREGLQQAYTQHQQHGCISFQSLQYGQHDRLSSSQEVTSKDIHYLLQEYTRILKSPQFHQRLAQVHADYDRSCLYVQFKVHTPSHNIYSHTQESIPSLDLHGHKSWLYKVTKMDRLIQSAIRKRQPRIDIITGRGLRNQHGVMGYQWQLFRDILTTVYYKPHVEKIESISKQGGWRLTLIPSDQPVHSYKILIRKNKIVLRSADSQSYIHSLNKELRSVNKKVFKITGNINK